MASKKVGALVKEARVAADLTQEKLAKKAGEGLTANDISKCEQGKADLTTAQLKSIAKVCGVTQTSLVNAPKNLTAAAAKKAAAEKKTAEKKTAEKKTAEKKTAEKKTATAKKPTTPANANTTMKVTTTEKKLVEAYRTATSDNKKIAMKILKGEMSETVTNLLGVTSGSSSSSADGIGDLLGDALAGLFGGKK